jgi:preprotein translocase subunit Sec63
MSLEEVAVIVLCLFGGCWVVSFLIDRRKAGDATPHSSTASSAGSQDALWPIILGVDPHASMEEIRQAYRLRMSEYHPDKVAGLGPELRELAERKAKEINGAYQEARRARGDPA